MKMYFCRGNVHAIIIVIVAPPILMDLDTGFVGRIGITHMKIFNPPRQILRMSTLCPTVHVLLY